MPFIPIVGVNCHLQIILFGCSYILDETEASFVWVLEMWVKAMQADGGHTPIKIIIYNTESSN